MLLILLFVLLAALSFSKKDNNKDVILVIVFLSLISVFFSRGFIDFPPYKIFYENIEPLYQVVIGYNDYFFYNPLHFELGYTILNSFLKMFTDHVEVLYVLSNFFILLVIYVFFKGKSLNFFKLLLPYLVFVFIITQVTIIRQAIAITIFFYCVRYIVEGNFTKYFFGTLIGFLFHRSALLLLLVYFIVRKNYSTKVLVGVFLVGILIYLQLFHFSFLTMVNVIVSYLPSDVGRKASFFTAELKDFVVGSRLTPGIFENVGVFILLVWVRKRLIEKELWGNFLNVCFNLSIIYIFIYIYFFEFTNIIYRLMYYFVFFKFFIIVRYTESLEIKNNRILGQLLLVIYCGIMLTIKLKQPLLDYLWIP